MFPCLKGFFVFFYRVEESKRAKTISGHQKAFLFSFLFNCRVGVAHVSTFEGFLAALILLFLFPLSGSF